MKFTLFVIQGFAEWIMIQTIMEITDKEPDIARSI